MKSGLYLLLIWIGLLLLSALSIQAQSTGDCTTLHVDTKPDGIIHFIEPSTGNIVHEDIVPYPFIVEHSPDCRWLVGYTNKRFKFSDIESCNPGVIIWDATTGNRIREFEEICDTTVHSYPHFLWKPDNSAVVITNWYSRDISQGSVSPRYLWYPYQNKLIELSQGSRGWLTFHQIEWDDSRHLIWSSGDGGIGALSMTTGEYIYWFPHESMGRHLPLTFFTFSHDQSQVIGHGQNRMDNSTSPAMTVFDITTGKATYLNVGLNAIGTVAISPNNRYVGMAYTAIRVWDLQNLGEDHLPTHRFYFPDSDIASWSFINSTTVEATSKAGDVMRWNLTTGQPIELSP